MCTPYRTSRSIGRRSNYPEERVVVLEFGIQCSAPIGGRFGNAFHFPFHFSGNQNGSPLGYIRSRSQCFVSLHVCSGPQQTRLVSLYYRSQDREEFIHHLGHSDRAFQAMRSIVKAPKANGRRSSRSMARRSSYNRKVEESTDMDPQSVRSVAHFIVEYLFLPEEKRTPLTAKEIPSILYAMISLLCLAHRARRPNTRLVRFAMIPPHSFAIVVGPRCGRAVRLDFRF
jgi:hypothetical protein